MDPHYYSADEYAMNFEGRTGSFAQLFSKIVPETVHWVFDRPPGCDTVVARAPVGSAQRGNSAVEAHHIENNPELYDGSVDWGAYCAPERAEPVHPSTQAGNRTLPQYAQGTAEDANNCTISQEALYSPPAAGGP